MKKLAFILAILLCLSACSTYRVMKDCKPLNPADEELKEYSACHEQWKFWR